MGKQLIKLTGGEEGWFAGSSWTFREGEHWAVTGASGSGKTLLCEMIAGVISARYPLELDIDDSLDGKVALLSFSQQQAEAAKNGWIQARYYSDEPDSVADFLSYDDVFEVNPFEVRRNDRVARRNYKILFERVSRLVGIRDLLDRSFMQLSNGETRRVLLARALLKSPKMLVLDDPAAGLDPAQREKLKAVIDALAGRGISILMTYRHEDELPDCITHFAEIRNLGFSSQGRRQKKPVGGGGKSTAALSSHTHRGTFDTGNRRREPVVELRDICISYGKRKLFEGFNWTVRRGERWVLKGPNGTGKTTIFSLVSGDNPLAYANDVTLFGVKRDIGSTLLDLRERIGAVSPEHQAYLGKGPQELIEEALSGNPELLLLDEPCMNLDAENARKLTRKIASWLKKHPKVTAICIAHRPEDVPPGFPLVVDLAIS